MVKKWIVLLVLVAAAVAQGAENRIPNEEMFGDTRLVLNGAGVRTKFFMSMYEAGLYVVEHNSDAPAVVEADEPMAIRLSIVSSLITKEKMQKATREGFKKSMGGNVAPLEKEIDTFIAVFDEGINKGDVYDFVYAPGRGIVVTKNGAEKARIAGLPFKRALFGIWLSEDPVQANLKKALLGG